MELETQKILRNTPNGLEFLKTRYAIDAKRHGEYENLVLLKYSMIESDFKEPIVQECRGLILDESHNWEVICWTFRKFHNFGEPLAAKIDWLSARVLEKLDGSLCQLHFYDGKWNVATSGTPDASGEVNGYGKTFKELFWEVWNNSTIWKSKLPFLNTRECYAFELCTPFNRVVVEHKESSVTLIGWRNLDTLKEQRVGSDDCLGVVKSFPVYTLADCIKAAEALNPLQQEGFVVVDKDFNRIKVKSPAYLMLHHAKDSLSKKKMCEVIRRGEYEEFQQAIETLPELKKLFDEIDFMHQTVRHDATAVFDRIKDIKDQKEFALQATKTGFPSILFEMRKSGKTAAQCLASPGLSIGAYMRMIEVK